MLIYRWENCIWRGSHMHWIWSIKLADIIANISLLQPFLNIAVESCICSVWWILCMKAGTITVFLQQITAHLPQCLVWPGLNWLLAYGWNVYNGTVTQLINISLTSVYSMYQNIVASVTGCTIVTVGFEAWNLSPYPFSLIWLELVVFVFSKKERKGKDAQTLR